MKNLIQKLWRKVKIAVIIVLSITIGSAWTYNYLVFSEMKKEAEKTWKIYESIKEKRNGDSAEEEKPKAESNVLGGGSAAGNLAATPLPSEIEKKIVDAFPECPEIAVAVAKAESKLNPKAYNKNDDGTEDKGIFQINSVHGYGNELYDIDTNIRVARKIWEKRQWSAWSAYKNKSYLAYLKN